MMLPRGSGRLGAVLGMACVVGVAVTWLVAGALGAAGALSCEKTARAAARAASVCLAERTPEAAVWGEFERACSSELLGGICMVGKIYRAFS